MSSYSEYSFWGRHFGWWFMWILFVYSIFESVIQKRRKNRLQRIINKRFISGQTSPTEYNDLRKFIHGH